MTGLPTESVVFLVEDFELLIQGTFRDLPDGRIEVRGKTPDLALFTRFWNRGLSQKWPALHTPTLHRDCETFRCQRMEWVRLHDGGIRVRVVREAGDTAEALVGAVKHACSNDGSHVWVVSRDDQEASANIAAAVRLLGASHHSRNRRSILLGNYSTIIFKTITQDVEAFVGADADYIACTVSAPRLLIGELALRILRTKGAIRWMQP